MTEEKKEEKVDRYVVEVNVVFESFEGKEKVRSKYLDFGTKENYNIYEGDSFDNIFQYIEKEKKKKSKKRKWFVNEVEPVDEISQQDYCSKI
jgi:hypothetical protein